MRSRSRSRSRGRSPRRGAPRSHSRGRRSGSRGSNDSDVVDKIRLTDADAAFILGRGGKTKEKIARVSGAAVQLPAHSMIFEITGTRDQRRKAKKYVECIMAQRCGEIVLDEGDLAYEDDCTLVDVPTDCAAFVTGTGGAFLRSLEEEFGTLMFFVNSRADNRRKSGGFEKLVIFGDRRGRRGAELKVMAAVEGKKEGYYTDQLDEGISKNEEWGTDIIRLRREDISWALGKKGSTRKKLARASGCIVEYIGHYVHLAGTGPERRRARDYLNCIMDQLTGSIRITTEGRDDVTVLDIPQSCVGYVTGLKRATLSRMEEDSGAFMIFLDPKEDSFKSAVVRLGIFGVARNRRAAELKVMSTVEGKVPGTFTSGVFECVDDAEPGTDIYRFHGDEFSYALGKDGATKRKLTRASGCIIEYLGDFAFMSGTRAERQRAGRYLRWLLMQRSGAVRVEELKLSPKDEDVHKMDIPAHTIAWVMGSKGCGLRAVEEDTGTFLFMARDRDGTDVLMVCGKDKRSRKQAEWAVLDVVQDYDRNQNRPPESDRDRDRDHDRDGRGGHGREPDREPDAVVGWERCTVGGWEFERPRYEAEAWDRAPRHDDWGPDARHWDHDDYDRPRTRRRSRGPRRRSRSRSRSSSSSRGRPPSRRRRRLRD